MKSIQTKLTVVILLFFLVALSALGGLNYWKAHQLLLDSVQANIATLAVNSGEDLGAWFDARKSELTMLAAAPVFLGGDNEALTSFMVRTKNANPVYTNLGYAVVSGDSLNYSGIRSNLSTRNYFQSAVKGEIGMSEMRLSEVTGNLGTTMGVPVKSDGKVTGVLFGTVSLEQVSAKVLAVKVAETGYAYLIQNDGLLLVHPDKQLVMKTNVLQDEKAPPELKAVAKRMVAGENGVVSYGSGSATKMLAFAPIPGTPWSFGIVVPTAEVTSSVSALTTISLVTSIVILLIAAVFIMWFARRIASPIRDLEAVATRIARGDLSMTTVGITSNDETGRLGQSFEQMTDNLRKLIHRILGVTDQVAASSEELTANAEQSAEAANQVAIAISQTAQGAERQTAAVTNTVKLVEQIAAGAQAEAADTKQAFEMTQRAVIAATNGNEAVDTAISQMNSIQATVNDSADVVAELGERTKEIGGIVETITNIAGQTNLLALNAAIEAARAGENGRGFAVVAEEVRKLAENSASAAKQIAALLSEIQAKTDSAVTAMTNGTAEVKRGTEIVDKAGVAFKDIMAQIKEIAAIAQKTSAGLTKLAGSSNEVLTSVKEVDAISRDIADQAQNISASTEEQSASMQEIASSSKALAGLAEDLQNAVRQFKL